MEAKTFRLLASAMIAGMLGLVSIVLVWRDKPYEAVLAAALLAAQNFALQLVGEKSATKDDVKGEVKTVIAKAEMAAEMKACDVLERSNLAPNGGKS